MTSTTTEINKNNHLSGGQLLVKTLAGLGVKRVFSVPGESYLPVLDALYDSDINNTVCRQEGGAAMAAEAWGKITGNPGICLVTRGPGATNASAGIHVAQQDSTPMILLVGQIDSRLRHREGFQEMHYVSVFHSMAKWVAEIDSVERLQEMVMRAWSIAISGRPGPVVLALPEDTLSAISCYQEKNSLSRDPSNLLPNFAVATHPSLQQTQALHQAIQAAAKPLLIVGGSRWNKIAIRQLQDYAEQQQVAVACSFRRQMLFDHCHPNYAGDLGLGANPELVNTVKTADLIVLCHGRLAEVASQNFTLMTIPHPQQTLIHIHSSAEELGKVYSPDMAMHADPVSMMAALTRLTSDMASDMGPTSQAANMSARQDYVHECHQHYLRWSTLPTLPSPGPVHMPTVIEDLAEQLPTDAIITNGAGNYASWVHRFWRFRHYGTQVAPTSGSMGYGLPAAMAAKLARPNKTVVCFAGDGCFQMTMQELGSAVQAKANIIVIIIDNGIYGTIRMHQEQHFPGRESGTRMVNPDFAKLASAYGINAYKVAITADFAPALRQALKAKAPALIHILLDEQVITPTQTLNEIRAQAEGLLITLDT